MSKLTIACVLKSGGHYHKEWVWALKRGLARHAPPHEFVCLTDMLGHNMWALPMQHAWPKRWSKIELFRPGLFSGRVWYVDLDTLIVSGMADICTYDGPFGMLSDFYVPAELASGVMTWMGDECAHIYEAFRANAATIMRRYGEGGRVDYWLRTVVRNAARLNDIYPGIVSLKMPRVKPRWKQPGPLEGDVIACSHGREPRLDNPKIGWAHEVWKSI